MAANERDPLLGDHARGDVSTTAAQSINHDGGDVGASPSKTSPGAELESPADPTTRELLHLMSTLMPCLFLAALDSTIVAALSGPISASFNSFNLFSWVGSAYLIANAAFQPLSGKLTDIYGRNMGWVFATTLFALGTLMCGLATRTWVIIMGRLVAGAGGGCINTVSTFITNDMVPLRKRGLWQGYGNIVFGAGMGLGGPLGGFINDRIGWKWAFLMQVPLIILAGVAGYLRINIPVKETDRSKLKRIDFLGAFCLVTALVLLLLGLNSGGNIVPWRHPLVYCTLPLSAIFLAMFIYVESRIAIEPIIPVNLLANRHLLACLLMNWFYTMSVFQVIYYVPIYFQVVAGQTTTAAGLYLVPESIGTSLGSLCCGLVMKSTGKYWWLTFTTHIIGVISGIVLLTNFTTDVTWKLAYPTLLGVGFGYGSMLTVTLTSMIGAVDHKYQALITSASYAFRSTGSSIGITIASAIFQNLLTWGLNNRFGHRPGAAAEIERIRQSVDEVRHLPRGWHQGTLNAYVDALRGVWVSALMFSVLCAAMGLLMREYTLYATLARR